MAELLVAAAGAMIGTAAAGTGVVALGMTGAQLGWMAGSMLGSMLFQNNPDGPKIEQGKFSSAIYGQPIPLNYGTMRHATQTAWWSGLIVRTESGGKKAGSYEMASMNLLLAVCEGPQQGVLRIWANGRLIYDATVVGVPFIDAEVLPAGEIRIYLGTETQMPDPTYEAAVGTAMAPAYRGTVMIAIDGLEAGQFANRPPNIEVEIRSTGVLITDDPTADEWPRAGLSTVVDDPFASDTGKNPCAYDPIRKRLYVTDKNVATLPYRYGFSVWDVSGERPVHLVWIETGVDRPDALPYLFANNHTAVFVYETAREACLAQPAGVDAYTTGDHQIINPPDELYGDCLFIVDGGAQWGQNWVIAAANTDPYGWSITYVPGADEIVVWRYDQTGVRDNPVFRRFNAKTFLELPPANFKGLTSEFRGMATYNPVTGHVIWWPTGVEATADIYTYPDGDQSGSISTGGPLNSRPFQVPGTTVGYFVVYSAGLDSGVKYFNFATEAVTATVTGATNTALRYRSIAWDSSRRKVYILMDQWLWVIDFDADPTVISQIIDLGALVPPLIGLGSNGGNGPMLFYDAGTDTIHVIEANVPVYHDDVRLYVINPADFSLLHTAITTAKPGGTAPVTSPSDTWDLGNGLYAGGGGVYTGSEAAYNAVYMFRGPQPNGVILQEIVEDLCERSGLPALNLDASAGIDIVAGFKIAAQTTARAAIDSLRPVYFFDMPEKGEQIVMVKRGGNSVATIDAGELGAEVFQVSGSNNATPYQMDHIEEQEIPRRLEVTYFDAAANYDPGIQSAERQVGSARATLSVEAPVVLTASQAAKIAWANLLLAHSSKNRIRFNLSHYYDELTPSDPVTIPHASGQALRVRVETISRIRPMLEIEGIPEVQSAYAQVVSGVPRFQSPRQSSIGLIGDTLLILLDLPPLRDADNELLIYSAIARDEYTDSWAGGSVYKSSDGGVSYDNIYTTTSGATIGASSGALGSWAGGNVWDDTNTLTVFLTSGTFSSATDLGVLNGANVLAVKSGTDWEIVQFGVATLVGTNQWELSHLLRGRKGTERAIAGHLHGDTVVLLDVMTVRAIPQSLAERGAVRPYKGVTSGQAVADATSQNFTLAGRSLMPLSPVHIAGSRLADDLTITWVRRVRIGAGFRAAVPLDEASESYSIDVMNGATVVRTLTSSTPTVTYTAAQQTTDFGAPQPAVTVRIYQLSATVGRGHSGEATI